MGLIAPPSTDKRVHPAMAVVGCTVITCLISASNSRSGCGSRPGGRTLALAARLERAPPSASGNHLHGMSSCAGEGGRNRLFCDSAPLA